MVLAKRVVIGFFIISIRIWSILRRSAFVYTRASRWFQGDYLEGPADPSIHQLISKTTQTDDIFLDYARFTENNSSGRREKWANKFRLSRPRHFLFRANFPKAQTRRYLEFARLLWFWFSLFWWLVWWLFCVLTAELWYSAVSAAIQRVTLRQRILSRQ